SDVCSSDLKSTTRVDLEFSVSCYIAEHIKLVDRYVGCFRDQYIVWILRVSRFGLNYWVEALAIELTDKVPNITTIHSKKRISIIWAVGQIAGKISLTYWTYLQIAGDTMNKHMNAVIHKWLAAFSCFFVDVANRLQVSI